MTGFKLMSEVMPEIRFRFCFESAPFTSKAFESILPFSRTFYHARISGREIWIDDVPQLDIIQENASVFVAPGEVVFGPVKLSRVRTANCFGIYYGEGKGLDACNIFAKVIEYDRQKLFELGNLIWTSGPQTLSLSLP